MIEFKNRLKFRAWDKRKLKMVYNDFIITPTSPTWAPFVLRYNDEVNKLLNDLDKTNHDYGGLYFYYDCGDHYAINEFVVMQFIGLTDKDQHRNF